MCPVIRSRSSTSDVAPPAKPSPNRRTAAGALLVLVAVVAAACGPPVRSRLTATRSAPGHSVTNIYAHDGAGMLAPAVRNMPYRLYVPESAGTGVEVIDPVAMQVIAHYDTGLDPQHVVPAWDLKTLYATNDLADTLTPINPYTGLPEAPAIAVADPYNLYFTPDGRSAIVVAEAQQKLYFRDPHTFAIQKIVPVDCAGVDHLDFSADGSFLVASCEFAARLVKVDLATRAVAGYLDLAGSSPQDVKLDPTGKLFYVADRFLGGVSEIDAASFTRVGFIPTGADAHGLYPSRNGRYLYVSNRGSGTISVVDFDSRSVLVTWVLPGGGSPDMGGVSPDGKVLWLTGRYDAAVYAISTADGHLIAKIAVPDKPHGMAVWPQPGRYSLGHTGIMR